MHDTLHRGKRFQTVNVIDGANRERLTIGIYKPIPSARLIRVLNHLIHCYGAPNAIRLDNGSELVSQMFTEWAAKSIAIRYTQRSKPNQNAFIECFNRTEVLDVYLFVNLEQVQTTTDQ